MCICFMQLYLLICQMKCSYLRERYTRAWNVTRKKMQNVICCLICFNLSEIHTVHLWSFMTGPWIFSQWYYRHTLGVCMSVWSSNSCRSVRLHFLMILRSMFIHFSERIKGRHYDSDVKLLDRLNLQINNKLKYTLQSKETFYSHHCRRKVSEQKRRRVL